MTSDREKKVGEAYRVTVILASAMILSILLYAGVVEILQRLAPSAPLAEPRTVELLRQVFRVLALAHFLAIAWLRGRARQTKVEPLARLARLKTLTMVCLALAEAVAIYGLVLFLLSRDSLDFYYLFLASALSFILAFPRPEVFRETLEA